MFTNKHVVVAMLVAPVLAIVAWYAVDYFLAERPHAAQPGASYRLVAKSNCRYASSQCDLENGNFKLTLRSTGVTADTVSIDLRSRFPLQQASIGFIDESPNALPTKMVSTDSRAAHWSAALAMPSSDTSTIGIAVKAQDATYFAEVPAIFLELDR